MKCGKSCPLETIQTVTTSAWRPEGPRRVAWISNLSPKGPHPKPVKHPGVNESAVEPANGGETSNTLCGPDPRAQCEAAPDES
jgi:hypothetical protein